MKKQVLNPRTEAPERAIVLVSGGIDSAVALWYSLRQGWEIHALSFDYFLRPRQEIAAAEKLLQVACVARHDRIPLPFLKELYDIRGEGRPLPGLEAAPGAYVPARNMIFYSLAAHYAEILGARRIVGGHNGGDVTSFPDSSTEFFEAFNELCRLGVRSFKEAPFQVVLPLANKSKLEVLLLAKELGAPLDLTWSCYWDGPEPCGTCPSCVERAAALAALAAS